ncbi:MAG: cadherin-like domain-containing protein, partial [Pirellula sp.]
MLAGLDVFVFDDVDASRGFGSRSDSPIFDRPVFVDINRDGRFDQSEPWTTTDIDGIARFRNLEPGEYTIRLLGENNRVLQSSPATPAATGVWHNEIGTVVRVESDGSAWTFSGNKLVKLNRALNTSIREFTFEGEIESVVLEDASSTVSKAYVIANNAAGQKKLWTIPDVQADAVQLTSAQLGDTSQIVSFGAEILIRNGNSLHRVTTDSVGQIASIGQIGGATLDDSSVLKKAGTSGFAVLNSAGNTSELSIYEISGTSAFVVGRRSFASEVKAWQPAPDGSSVAVSTADDFLIVEKKVGLPTAAILKDAVEPILFDAGRSLLLTGNKTNSSELIGWQTSEWKQSLSIPITNGELTGPDATLSMDRFGRFLIGNRLGRAYSHDLAEAVLVTAVVSANGTSQVQIGIRLLGQNSAPSLGEPAQLSLNEDDAIQWSTSMLGSVSSDMDSDRLIYLVRSQPTLGSVAWNADGNASYIPAANANGADSFTVQAYDGWAWSEERSITVNVFAV